MTKKNVILAPSTALVTAVHSPDSGWHKVHTSKMWPVFVQERELPRTNTAVSP